MKAASVLLCVPLLLLPVCGARAERLQPVGSTVTVVNLVTAAYNRDTRTLHQGDPVHQDELIEVGLDGSGEIKLDDETKLALGPGSHLKLDTFVYDPAKTKGSVVLDLLKGTFRFMTGVAEKPAYVIKTPAAAITVRGTIFDVYVQDDGLSWLLLLEGAVQVCNSRGVCEVLDEPGKLIRIGGDGAVGNPVKWASLPGTDKVGFDNAFPFVTHAPSIDPDPIFTRDVIVLGTLPPRVKPPKRDTYDDKTESKPETPTSRPTKRRKRPPVYEEKPKYERIKRRKRPPKKEKTRRADDKVLKKGIGAAIGIGIGIGKSKPGRSDHGGMGRGGSGTYGGSGGRRIGR